MKQSIVCAVMMVLMMFSMSGFAQVDRKLQNSTNRGVITLKTAAAVDSAIAANAATVRIYAPFIGGSDALNVTGKWTKTSGTPAGKCYFVVGNNATDMARIDSVSIYGANTSQTFTFSLPSGQASYSYYGLELVTTGSTHASRVKGTLQGRTPPEVKQN